MKPPPADLHAPRSHPISWKVPRLHFAIRSLVAKLTPHKRLPFPGMDIEQLRTKRLKALDSLHSSPADKPINTSNMVMPDISGDEKFARELQADIERDERPARKSTSPSSSLQPVASQHTNMDWFEPPLAAPTDEDFARQLQEQFEQEDALFQTGAFAAMPPTTQLGPPFFPSVSGHDPLYSDRRKPSQKRMLDGAVPSVSVAHAVDKSDDAQAAHAFASATILVNCRRCHDARSLTRDKLVDFFTTLLSGNPGEDINFVLLCETCGSRTCLGCGATLTFESLEFGAAVHSGKHFTWHCDRGRLALIWFLLCGYDNQAQHNKSKAMASRKLPSPVTSKQKDREYHSFHHPHGHQSSMAKGTGYAPDGTEEDFDQYLDDDEAAFSAFAGQGVTVGGHITPPVKVRTPDRAVDPDDQLTAEVMAAVAAVLPSPVNFVPTEFDMNPPVILRCMLMRSSILDKTAELLRNDSLEDATSRYKLYDNVMNFIRSLAAGGRITAEVLHAERTINKAGHDLLRVSYGLPTRMNNENTDSATPIMATMANLTSQSNMMLRNAQAHQEAFESDEGQQLLQLCTNIIECNELLQTSTPRRSAKAKAKEVPNVDQDAWQKDHAVLEVADEDILAVHYSAKAAKDMKNPQPGRMRSLAKEVASLRTSLPPGIFVRYGESRLDVMKALIIGPKGTPYENGLFEFDIFCPANYPNEPPQMHIKTTGGGKHRFNPNLYADGKVCLSLLNTWQGQRWIAGQSTILQVLVSIQAMIFCDEPHCNEPGYEGEAGTEQSRDYNRGQYAAVVKYAMLEWLSGERKVTPSRADYRNLLAQSAPPMPPVPPLPVSPGGGEIPSPPVLDFQPFLAPTYTHTPSFSHVPMPPHTQMPPPPMPPSYQTWPGLKKHGHHLQPTAQGQPPSHVQPLPQVQAPPQVQALPQGQQPPQMPPPHQTYASHFLEEYSDPQPSLQAHPPPQLLPHLQQYPLPQYQPPPHVPIPSQIPLPPYTPMPPQPPPHHEYARSPKRPEAPVDKGNMWAAVVKKHFEVRQDEILETVCGWINDKSLNRYGKGKRLGSAGEVAESVTKTYAKGAELKAKGKDLRQQLKAALDELPRGRHASNIW